MERDKRGNPAEKTLFKKAIDFYKTAPVGETFVFYSLSMIPVDLSLNAPLLLVFPITGLISGVGLTRRQFKLRERLESSIEKFGYQDRVMELTTEEWCNRQTARVVAQDNDKLDEYNNLRNTTGE